MYNFLYTIFSTPFGYVMRLIYQFVQDYALSIFLFALLVKILMLPLTFKQKRSMMEVQRIQPKLEKIRKTYAMDQRRMQEEMQNLYEKEGVSPSAGCGTSLIILPIMIGLYGVILKPLTYFMQLTAAQISEIASRLSFTASNAYSEIGLAGEIFKHFDQVADVSQKLMPVSFTLGPIDLTQSANMKQLTVQWVIPVLAGLTSLGFSWLQQKLMNTNKNADPAARASGNMMLWMMPIMSVWFCFMLPAGLGVYWISNNILSAVQEFFMSKWTKKQMEKAESQGQLN